MKLLVQYKPTVHDWDRAFWQFYKYDGPGLAKGGSGVLKVDGKEVTTKSIPHTTPVLLTMDETFDIGSDTRTPVDDADYQVPFPFTGTISKVDFKLGPSQMLPEDSKAAQDMKNNMEKLEKEARAAHVNGPRHHRHERRSTYLDTSTAYTITDFKRR